ncbi:MAG: hypothetical protein Q9204_004174 [Flavoplaca sp. TL-2023a]
MCGPLPKRRHVGVYRQGTNLSPSALPAVRFTVRSAEAKFESLTDDEGTMEAAAEEGESLQTQVVRWWLARQDLAKRFVKENENYGRSAPAKIGSMERAVSLTGKHSSQSMDWTPSPTGSQLTLAAWRPPARFQPGLGSLSVLPPEIRSKIWALVLPTTDDCFDLESLSKRFRVVEQVKRRNALAVVRASKQLYKEVNTQFYHRRGLAIVFTTAENIPLQGPQDSGPRWRASGVVVNSIEMAQNFAATNFANFFMIMLMIELPHPVGSKAVMDRLVSYIQSFSRCLQDWQERLGLCMWCPCVDIVLYTRPMARITADTTDDEDDGSLSSDVSGTNSELSNPIFNVNQNTASGVVEAEDYHDSDGLVVDPSDFEWPSEDDDDDFLVPHQLYPSLKSVALVLQPLRDIQKSLFVTVRADFKLHFGQEWLSVLLEQVKDDMQKVGKTRPGHWGWRQKNMGVALEQSDEMTRDFALYDTLASGDPLPIGPPEELANDGIE